jgi:hypothetical protein
MGNGNIIKYTFTNPDDNLIVITSYKCGTKFFESQKNLKEKIVFESTISFKGYVKNWSCLVWRDPIEHLKKAIWTEFGMCDTFDEIYNKIINNQCVHFSKFTYKTIWFSLKDKKYYTCHLNDINNLLFAPNITWAMVPTKDLSHLIKEEDLKKFEELIELAKEDKVWLDKLLLNRLQKEPSYEILHEKKSLI